MNSEEAFRHDAGVTTTPPQLPGSATSSMSMNPLIGLTQQQPTSSVHLPGLQLPLAPELALLLQNLPQHQPPQQQPQAPDVFALAAAQMQAQLTASLTSQANQAHQNAAGFNPLLLSLVNLQQPFNPLYSNLAKMLLTLNMNQQLLAAQNPANDLLAALSQENALSGLPRPANAVPIQQQLGFPQLAQMQATSRPQFTSSSQAQFVPSYAQQQMSLKRSAPSSIQSAIERKKSCPVTRQRPQPTAPPARQLSQQIASKHHQHHPPHILPMSERPLRALTPVWEEMKKFIANISDEDREKNNQFKKVVMDRLDIILLEELGPYENKPSDKPKEEELVEDKPDAKEKDENSASLNVDVEGASPEPPPGTVSSAFRRVSRNMEASASSNTDSSETSKPSTLSPSSSPSLSPTAAASPTGSQSAELCEKLQAIGLEHKAHTILPDVFCNSDAIFDQKFPLMWSGAMKMKQQVVAVNLHFISGSKEFFAKTFGSFDGQHREMVHIKQQMRLEKNLNSRNTDLAQNPSQNRQNIRDGDLYIARHWDYDYALVFRRAKNEWANVKNNPWVPRIINNASSAYTMGYKKDVPDNLLGFGSEHCCSSSAPVVCASLVSVCFGVSVPACPQRSFVRLPPNSPSHTFMRQMHSGNYATMLCLCRGSDANSIQEQQNVMQKSFIDYLDHKQIAGIAHFQEHGALQQTLVHVFSNSQYTDNYLKGMAAGLKEHLVSRDMKFLLVILTPKAT
ncbi:unnamed protein product [Caenorhabditis auriculariae]|uniref:SPOC domain-containing protein n=1 Tax=Caenorhabditis auriculariae TaxID=2777116 RepID=A0A8S1HFG3_9PELO|nr:unnamed protein product [Caenorhabditis auriculariae]